MVGGFGGAWYVARQPAQAFPRRLAGLYAWMGVVGVGSFLFHATLKYSMQLLDEIPMLFCTAHTLHCLVHPEMGLFPRSRLTSAGPFYALAVGLTALYVAMPRPVLFQACFGALTLGVAGCYRVLDVQLQARRPGTVAAQQVHRLLLCALGLLVVSFGVWNVDNLCCRVLRQWRLEMVPAALAPLLQLHAWWHVGTMLAGAHSLAAVLIWWCELRGVAWRMHPAWLPFVRIGRG